MLWPGHLSRPPPLLVSSTSLLSHLGGGRGVYQPSKTKNETGLCVCMQEHMFVHSCLCACVSVHMCVGVCVICTCEHVWCIVCICVCVFF